MVLGCPPSSAPYRVLLPLPPPPPCSGPDSSPLVRQLSIQVSRERLGPGDGSLPPLGKDCFSSPLGGERGGGGAESIVSSGAPPGNLQRCQSHEVTLRPSKPCSVNRHHKAPEASGDSIAALAKAEESGSGGRLGTQSARADTPYTRTEHAETHALRAPPLTHMPPHACMHTQHTHARAHKNTRACTRTRAHPAHAHYSPSAVISRGG